MNNVVFDKGNEGKGEYVLAKLNARSDPAVAISILAPLFTVRNFVKQDLVDDLKSNFVLRILRFLQDWEQAPEFSLRVVISVVFVDLDSKELPPHVGHNEDPKVYKTDTVDTNEVEQVCHEE